MSSTSTRPELMINSLLSLYQDTFGGEARIFRAPGRVNLIGEHTDYNDGFVLPAAIGFCTYVAAGSRDDRVLRAYSDLFDEEISLSLDELSGRPKKHWSDFIRGVAATLQQAGYRLSGTNLTIHGEVPLGAGLSSSASLEVALALALSAIAKSTPSPLELVRLCQKAEHEFVGTRCGIMDQFAATFGEKGNAILLDCRSLEYRLIPIPRNARWIVCNSMVRHELASGEYNRRRADCEAAVRLLHAHLPSLNALRDLDVRDLEHYQQKLPEQIYRRCRHVVGENQRVLKAAAAMEAEDLEQFGQLMDESHASLRDDYEVSCKELDLLVDLASAIPGVLGARMTGGGFGGCTVNLVLAESAADFQNRLAQAYSKETGIVPEVYVCEPAEGAVECKATRTSHADAVGDLKS